eukprot:SAG11_NODE_25810_length_353_cov_1.476378_1_plen_71_part_01
MLLFTWYSTWLCKLTANFENDLEAKHLAECVEKTLDTSCEVTDITHMDPNDTSLKIEGPFGVAELVKSVLK